MKFSCSLLFLLFYTCCLQAQTPVTIEMGTVLNAAGNPVSDGVMIYGSESLKKNVSYSDVKGSPYANDSFRVSLLYDAGDKLIGKVMSRINFYTYQLHYLNKQNMELAVSPDQVRRVEFLNPADESQVMEEYSSKIDYFNVKMDKLVYVQLFNKGETKLVKSISRTIGTYDSLMGNFKRYMFVRREDFYLMRKSTVEHMRKFSKEKIFAFTRHEDELEAYVTKEKLDLRKEKEVAKLIDYLNQITKTSN